MKVVTTRPSDIARSVDIVDRDIGSNLEILQETVFPLPPIPAPLDLLAFGTGVVVSRSFATHYYKYSENTITSSSNLNLGKGLWRITGNISYSSNFVGVAIDSGFRLQIGNFIPVAFFDLVNIQPDGTLHTRVLAFDFDLLIDRDNFVISAYMGAAGLAQYHVASLGMRGSKYL